MFLNIEEIEALACENAERRHEAAAKISALCAEVRRLWERDAALCKAISEYYRVLIPVRMQIAQDEMLQDDLLPDSTIILHFMGSGASDMVDLGTFRRADEIACAALGAQS